MLVNVQPDPLVVLPSGMDWSSRREAGEQLLRETRDELAPDARIAMETDLSVPRALERVARRNHRDLLVVGSSRHTQRGAVRIGKRTRQLLAHAKCALAIAPRGIDEVHGWRLKRIGLGYDGGPEADVALSFAASLAHASGASLHVRGVIDDRIPRVALAGHANATFNLEAAFEANEQELISRATSAARDLDPESETDVMRGRPADRLAELDVDLLVIGSRRWGAMARLLLGSTGEALLQDLARCPVIVVPKPAD